MRAMLNSRRSIAMFFAFVISTLSACSSGDTVLALTISSTADVGAVANVRVTVSQPSAAPKTITFAPEAADGAIVASFFKRIALDGLKDGDANVLVEALDGAGTTFLSATTTAGIMEHHVVAASVQLTRARPAADAGTGDGG